MRQNSSTLNTLLLVCSGRHYDRVIWKDDRDTAIHLSYIILRSSIIALGRQLRLLFKAWPAKKQRDISNRWCLCSCNSCL